MRNQAQLVDNDTQGVDHLGGNDILLKGNKSTSNAVNGINVTGGAGTKIIENKAHDNGGDGIRSTTADLVLKKNKANGNGDLGIEVPAGTDNAKNNGDPEQCLATDVGCFVAP